MLENAVYSVISPEGCASILWRSGDQAQDAAEAMKLTAQDLLKLGVVDAVVPEPVGAAHRFPTPAITALGDALEETMKELMELDPATLQRQRHEKFLAMGAAKAR
jgi:acetyl-CoA carboxylase carboxyl transferase subunit alpha